MDQLGIALIGAGFMGRRHLLGYAALRRAGVSNCAVVAVLDLDPAVAHAAADTAAELLGSRPRVCTSLTELLNIGEVRAVDIVTDPRTHHSIGVTAMEAGRHVLCEKPLALTVATARSMVDAAERTGTVLATGENYRRGGANRLARAVLDAGLLGRIQLMREVRVGGDDRVIISPWRHHKVSGSIGLDMAIHYADIVEYLLGPVEKVWGRGFIAEPIRYPTAGGDAVLADGEDSIVAGLRTAAGVDVQLAYVPAGPGHRYGERTVHGSLGSMQIPPDRSDGDVVLHLGSGSVRGPDLAAMVDPTYLPRVTTAVLGPDGTGGAAAPWAEVDAGYLAVEIEDFADAALSGRSAEVDGMGGLRALAVVHAILESGVAGREVSVAEVLNGSLHAYQDDIDAQLAPLPC